MISVQSIVGIVAHEFSVPVEAITGTDRARHFVWPRQAVCLLARRHTKASYPLIGFAIGGRDHTTVLHGVRSARARKQMEFLEPLARASETIDRLITFRSTRDKDARTAIEFRSHRRRFGNG